LVTASLRVILQNKSNFGVGQAEAQDLIMQNKPNSPAACRTNKANSPGLLC